MTPDTAHRRAHPQTRRKTFKQAVPSDLQTRLDEFLLQGVRSSERLAELFQSHALAERFGVTLAQFRRFAAGVKNRTSAPDTPMQVPRDGPGAHSSSRSTGSSGPETTKPRPVRALRQRRTSLLGRDAFHKRMKAIGEIVDNTFGVVAAHQPDLWGHGAYLMLVGSVVACLAERHSELSTSELATLSKILAEQRSLTLKQAEADRKLADQKRKISSEQLAVDAEGNGDPGGRRLPAHFGDVVRQIYGTSFQDDFTVDSEARATGPDDPPGATGGLPTSAGAESSLGSTR